MKTIFKLLLSLILVISIVGCNNKKPSKTITNFGEISVVTPAEFKEKSINQIIVDIRTPQEFLGGHIEGAVNINLFDNTFLTQISEFDKSKPIFLYCRSGNRTHSASKKIAELGFEKIYDLQGGIKNWAKSNYQIIK